MGWPSTIQVKMDWPPFNQHALLEGVSWPLSLGLAINRPSREVLVTHQPACTVGGDGLAIDPWAGWVGRGKRMVAGSAEGMARYVARRMLANGQWVRDDQQLVVSSRCAPNAAGDGLVLNPLRQHGLTINCRTLSEVVKCHRPSDLGWTGHQPLQNSEGM